MELFDAIAKRHSYRGEFTDAAVSKDDLIKIVTSGIWAPSACNEQVASFVIINEPSLVAKIAGIVRHKPCDTAKAMIVCVVDPRPVYRDVVYAAEDCAAAVENMLLAITALGYATVWLDGVLRADDIAARIGELLGVPQSHTVRVLLPIGVPAAPGTRREKLPFEKRAWFNRYGG